MKCGESYSEVFSRLRQERLRQNSNITNICKDIQTGAELSSSKDDVLQQQLDDLCEIYDKIIKGACDECEQYLHSIDQLENENLQLSARTLSASPRKSRPGSSIDTDKYYTELLQSSEHTNLELRQEIERLHKEMNLREKNLFNKTMARIGNNDREQAEKMKAQIAELSQEMSLLNVDNRALRERILKTENENEILCKQVSDTTAVDDELKSLQSNLDNQLALNHALETKVKELELLRLEHGVVCERVKGDLQEATEKMLVYEAESKDLRHRLEESRDLQQKFDDMNTTLHDQLIRLQSENGALAEEVGNIQREVTETRMVSAEEAIKQTSQDGETIKQLENDQLVHQQQILELTTQLESSDQQRQNANQKVKALRERLKNMQDSWQKISTDTESSFCALRDQYQQQIKEYKSIVESLKSQNSSLTARIDTLKAVTSQHNSSQLNNLEQQVGKMAESTIFVNNYDRKTFLLSLS